jgi:hypothetical protein
MSLHVPPVKGFRTIAITSRPQTVLAMPAGDQPSTNINTMDVTFDPNKNEVLFLNSEASDPCPVSNGEWVVIEVNSGKSIKTNLSILDICFVINVLLYVNILGYFPDIKTLHTFGMTSTDRC